MDEQRNKINPIVLVGIAVFLFLAGIAGIFISRNTGPVINPPTAGESPIPATSNQTTVEIKNFVYVPATIRVKAGDSVTFINRDSVGHTATANDGSFDTGMLSKDQSRTITFSKAGTYNYFCTPHPYMKGVVIVE